MINKYCLLCIICVYTVNAFANPAWIKNPYIDGYISAVGIAKPQNGGLAIQKRVALAIAREELAERIKVNISSEINITKKCQGDENCTKSIFQTIHQKSSETIKSSFIKDSYIDPLTKEMYVLVVMPQENITMQSIIDNQDKK